MATNLPVSLTITADGSKAVSELGAVERGIDKTGAAAKKAALNELAQVSALRDLTSTLDEASARAQRLSQAQATLDNALQRGTITQQRYDQLLGQARQRWDESTLAQQRAQQAAEQQAAALTSLSHSLDESAARSAHMSQAQATLDNALQRGAITQQRYDQLLGQARQRWDESTLAQQRAEQAAREETAALAGLTAALDPATTRSQQLSQAQATLDAALQRGAITQQRHAELLQAATRHWGAHNAAVGQGGRSARQTAVAMQQLPAQITDVVTSLASGQQAWLVAIQQGGQIKDSFGGIAPAFRAVTAAVRPMLAVLGTVATVATILASIALAYKQGSDEADRYASALINTGRASGETVGSLSQHAKAVAEVTGRQHEAAGVIAQLTEKTQISGQRLEDYTRIAIQWGRATGAAVDDTVQRFAELGKDPVSASEKLNETMHYLTASTYEQITALQEQGRHTEAARVAQDAFANAIAQRTGEVTANLGTIESSWNAIKGATLGALQAGWDYLLNIGRMQSAEQQLATAQDNLNRLRERNSALGIKGGKGTDDAQAEVDRLRGIAASDALKAQNRATDQKLQEYVIEGDKRTKALLDRAKSQSQRRTDALAQLEKDERLRIAAGLKVDPAQSAAARAAIADLYKDPKTGGSAAKRRSAGGGAGKNTAFQAARAEATEALAGLRANLQVLQAQLRSQDDVLEGAYKQGTLALETTYQQRLGLIRQQATAERQALEQQRAEIDRALATAKTPQERTGLAARRVQVEAQLKVLDTSLADSTRKLREWRDGEEKQLSALSVKLRVELAGVTGQVDREALAQQVADSLRDERLAIGRLPDGEQAAARAQLETIGRAAVAQAQFNAVLQQTGRINEALQVQEAAITAQRDTGGMSAAEAEVRLALARADSVPAIQAVVAELEKIKDAVPPEAQAVLDKMAASIGGLRISAEQALPAVGAEFQKAQKAGIDSLVQQLGNVDTAFQSLPKTVGNVLKAVANQILQSGVREALRVVFTPGGGGGSGGFWAAALTGAKAIFGFAEGGQVRGPGTGTSDSIPALVGGVRPIAISDGEFIQPTRAVDHYGLPFMEAIRTLRFPKPRFAFGGLATAHAQARFATGGQARRTGGAGAVSTAPAVVVQVVNKGTPQRVTGQEQRWDGREMMVSLFTEDLVRGGPMSQALAAAQARGR